MNDYNRYLERYCKQYKVSKEEAEKHSLVQEVKQYYQEEAKKDNE